MCACTKHGATYIGSNFQKQFCNSKCSVLKKMHTWYSQTWCYTQWQQLSKTTMHLDSFALVYCSPPQPIHFEAEKCIHWLANEKGFRPTTKYNKHSLSILSLYFDADPSSCYIFWCRSSSCYRVQVTNMVGGGAKGVRFCIRQPAVWHECRQQMGEI